MSLGSVSAKAKASLPWTIRLAISVYTFISRFSLRSDITVNRRLHSLINFKVSPSSSKPRRGVSSFDIIVESSRDLWLRLYVPTITTNNKNNDTSSDVGGVPIIVYYHGGGFVFNSPATAAIDGIASPFSSSLHDVAASVNYRLAPEHLYPYQYDDEFDVLKFIDAMDFDSFQVNVDKSMCFIAGDNAGGNLGHHMAVKASVFDHFKRLRVIGFIAMQPFVGGEERTESEIRLVTGPLLTLKGSDRYWKAFLPDGSNRDHPAANVSGPKSDDISIVDYPETLLVIGGYDPLQDWQRRYYEKLRRSGKQVRLVEYPKAIHGFYAFSQLPKTALFINDVKNFITAQISKCAKKCA